MAKSKEHLTARRMRRHGKSIKDIAKMLGVSKSSASVWCSDIVLTEDQIDKLHEKMIAGSYRGRLVGARLQKESKEKKIKNHQEKGVKEIGLLNYKEFLLLGLGLYLGEGSKTRNQFQFVNSNPDIIRLVVSWLKRCFGIKKNSLYFSILINEVHRSREKDVRRFWKRSLHIKNNQFRKTIFIRAKNKKIYENFKKHFGTVSLRVKKSSDLQYRIWGLCYGIIENTPR